MSLFEVLVVACVVMVITAVVYPMFSRPRPHGKAASAQNCRQIALAGLMYSSDYDDRLMPTMNGWMGRLQNRGDKQLTINCPGPGTQDLPAPDAAGAEPTRTWVHLLMPYIMSRRLFLDPQRSDFDKPPGNYFGHVPMGVGDPGYDANTWTWRNQGRFPMYGLNYTFLSPLQIPKTKLGRSNAVNYAEGRGIECSDAADPSGTVFFTESQFDLDNPESGFFVINAPGMWPTFAANKQGYVAFWRGTAGSGDWTKNACVDFGMPCRKRTVWNGFANMSRNDGANATFLDGHVRYMKAEALAAGTDYVTAPAKPDGSGATIIDPKHYLWDLK